MTRQLKKTLECSRQTRFNGQTDRNVKKLKDLRLWLMISVRFRLAWQSNKSIGVSSYGLFSVYYYLFYCRPLQLTMILNIQPRTIPFARARY